VPERVVPVLEDRSTRRRVLLIVAGGIAAYKAPELVRALIAAGCSVQVVLTPAARAFVSELALAVVSTRPVRSSLLDPAEEGRVGHIELADWPDLVLVAPGTADLLARAAAGLADDLAATVLLATRAPVLWAPAMNTNMWRHPATQQQPGHPARARRRVRRPRPRRPGLRLDRRGPHDRPGR
jgi:phosphopantothenoylcysteine decarboxylase/phosphopantothenate--cysteine ligase